MNPQSRDTVTFLLGTLMSLLVLCGLVVKFILLPWLKDHLLQPVSETHRQVSENGHVNDPPTVPDLLHELATDVKALTHVMDEHMRWSDRWAGLVDRELDQLRREGRNGE